MYNTTTLLATTKVMLKYMHRLIYIKIRTMLILIVYIISRLICLIKQCSYCSTLFIPPHVMLSESSW